MNRFECVMQDGPKDCGICALLTIIKTHGGLVSKEYLRNLTNTSSNGVNALSLIEAGKKLGFHSEGVKGDVLRIEDKFLPCIAHVIIDNKYKHFVVIHKIDRKNKYITIADPSRGIIKMDVDKFRTISTSNYLFFTPIKRIPVMMDNDILINKLKDFIYNNKHILLTIVFFSLLFILINIIITFNFQFIIDRAINNNSIKNLYVITLFFILIYSLKNFLEYGRENMLSFLSHKMNYIMINDSLNHILSLPHLYFKNRTTGEILSRLSDLDELKDLISDFIVTIFVDFSITIVSIITIFLINRKLFTIILFVLLMYSLITIIYNKIISNDIKIIKEENAKVNSSIIELINGINTIKGLNIIGKSKEEFSYLYNNYLNVSYDLTNKINKKKSVDSIISNLITLIVLAIGGSLVIKEELNISSLITINSIIFINFSSLSKILNFDLIMKKTKIIIERINELLNIKEEKIFFDLNPLKNINGGITVKNLTYKYGDNIVFKNFSMILDEGKKILITGDSGCGKSTLAKLISGFIEVKRNKIFIGKYDVNDINLWNLREQITYVSQDEYLFNSTIFDNINIKNTRDKNKIIDIAKCMLIDEIVSKNPSGYNMILEENARNLSGGERQRIILARTFLKNSNIYILDETFSEINIEKERIILKNIFEKFKDKTIIVISHRLNNNDLYDKVFNMEEYESRFISRKFQE